MHPSRVGRKSKILPEEASGGGREIAGWSLKPRMAADIATDALTMTWFRRRPTPGLLHHSDRGSQHSAMPT